MDNKAVVLVVDDKKSVQSTIQSMLKDQDYNLIFAHSGLEAIKKARENRPDLVLLDVVLPDIDGYKVCRQLRTDPELASVAIVLLTSLSDRDSRMQGFEAGCDDFLIKPVATIELWTRVRTHILLSRYRRLVSERNQFHRYIEKKKKDVQFAEVARETTDGLIILEGKDFISFVNQTIISMLKFKSEKQLLGLAMSSLIDDAKKNDYRNSMAALTQLSPGQHFETRLKRADGSVIAVEIVVGTVFRDNKPKLQLIVRNISELKRIETALQESEEKYRRIFNNIQDVYFEAYLAGTIIEISPSVKHVFGYDRIELLGKPFCKLFYDQSENDKFKHEIEEKLDLPDYEIVMKNNQGKPITCSINVILEKDKLSGPRKAIGSIRDISRRKQTEEQFRLMEKAIQTTHTGITITDTNGKILFVNPAEAEMHGYSQEELYSKDVGIFAPPEMRRRLTPEQIKKMKNRARESINLRANGEKYPVYLRSDAVFNQKGDCIGIVTTSEDITERKKVEQELKQYRDHLEEMVKQRTLELTTVNEQLQNEIAERKKLENEMKQYSEHLEEQVEQRTLQMMQTLKLASLGTFSRGSAHEQRQYQQTVLTAAQRIKNAVDKFKKNKDVDEFVAFISERIAAIENAVHHSNSLVNSLLEYSRGKPEEYVITNVSEQVKHTLTIVGHSIKQDNITLKHDIEDTPPIFGSPTQIKELTMNLLTNAWHAVKQSATGDKYISCKLSSDNHHIYLVIEDNGIGIKPEERQRIFDVYYTTKSPQEGTGLGLSIVSRYVQNHKGSIDVKSEPLKGSTFTITLPLKRTKDD